MYFNKYLIPTMVKNGGSILKKNAYRAKLKSFTKSSYQIGSACANSSFKQSKSKSIHTTVAVRQFPSREWGGGVYQPIIWQKNVYQKLHENVRNWTGVWGAQGTRVSPPPRILHCTVSLSRLFNILQIS